LIDQTNWLQNVMAKNRESSPIWPGCNISYQIFIFSMFLTQINFYSFLLMTMHNLLFGFRS